MTVTEAIILSDVHLGWVPLRAHHRRFLAALDQPAGAAELIVLNGDIVDRFRGHPAAAERDLVAVLAEQVASWRAEGRTVVYIEGNHDPQHVSQGEGLIPDRWHHDFVGADDARIRVLHGHRFADRVTQPTTAGPYERYGQRFLKLENWVYARTAPLRWIYPASIGWMVGAVGKTEDMLWRKRFLAAVDAFADEVDVVVHGHFHFGPGAYQHRGVQLYRSGAWVSRGHRGSVDGVLRYSGGRFQRMTLAGDLWVARDDGR